LTALIVGTVLALGTLTFVLLPLFATESIAALRSDFVSRADQSIANGNPAIEALREIEFDRETGKLSDADYDALKSEYTQRALAVMRGGDVPVCPACGPRPEKDAVFCSKCGALLAA
jgi:ribosomal protein L40E